MTDQRPADDGRISAFEEGPYENKGADGRARYPSVSSLTDLIQMLNDGKFNQDCIDKLGEFSADMEEMGCDTERKVKGKIVLTIEVDRETDGIYFFTPSIKFKLPEEKGQRTIGWVTPDNRFTPNKPHQGNLFGTIREVGGDRTVRGA